MTRPPRPPQQPLPTPPQPPQERVTWGLPIASPMFPSFTGLETPQEGAPHSLAPRLAPALSAHLPWALIGRWGQSCFTALGALDTGPLLPPASPKGLSPPRCPSGLCEGARNRLGGAGVSAFCARLSHLPAPPAAWSTHPCGFRRAAGLPPTPPHPHPSLFPALGVSQKLVLMLPATLS